MLNKHIDQIRREAVEGYPNEVVWVVTDEECTQLVNQSNDPQNSFKVDDLILAKIRASGIEFCLVHSHPDAPAVPSASDMAQQMAGGETWAIISTDGVNTTDLTVWGGAQNYDLWNRPFIHGITDCWSFIRDRYALDGIALVDYPRSWEWWNNGDNIYVDNLTGIGGFELVGHNVADIEKGDLLLFSIKGQAPNHAAYYEGDELISHHSGSRLPYDNSRSPRKEPVHPWLDFLVGIYRHKEMAK